MKAVRRIAKNTIAMILGDIGAKVFTVSYTILLARHLLVEGFGVLSFFLTVVGLLGLLTDVGFFELTIREVARNRNLARKYLSNVILLKLLIIVLTFGSFFLYLLFSNYPYEIKVLSYLLGLALAVDSIGSVFRSIIQAFEKMEFVSAGKILRSAILFVGVVYIVHFDYGLLEFGILYFLANFLSFLYLSTITLKKLIHGKFPFEYNKEFWKFLLKEGIPFWAATAFIVILNDTDKIMLYAMIGEKAVGYYSAAYRIVFSLNFIPLMFIAAIYPVTSRLFTKSVVTLVDVSEKAFKFVLIVGLTVVISLSSFSEFIILTIFGDAFAESSTPLKILAWSQLFLYLNVVLRNLFRSADMQIVKTYQFSAAAILNIFLNFLLIPYWSFVGASIATLLARAFSFALLSFLAVKRFNFSKVLLLQALLVILSVLILVYLYDYTKNLFIFVAGLIILFSMYYTKIFNDADKKIIMNLVKINKDGNS